MRAVYGPLTERVNAGPRGRLLDVDHGPIVIRMIDFSDRVAWITGGSRGIGAATVRRLSSLGARVAFTYHARTSAAEALVEEIGPDRARARRVDVRDPAAMAEAVDDVVDAFDGLDVVVANAGIWPASPIEEMSEQEWRDTVEINLGGTYLACRHGIPALVARGGGSVVVVSSTAGQRGEAGHAHYAASKGGQIAFVKSLAVECAPTVRVNAVAPGWVDTEMSETPLHGHRREAILAEIPLGRVATADDVACAIAFLASDAARHVTGEVLNVNGGSVLCG